ncbi:MAG: nitric oxide reductase transcriptional regulator NorR [Planctomycetes bacterium]|nr:nitric oxide reductase transcriptional regulator NorR [Planctomycetota bacterium]
MSTTNPTLDDLLPIALDMTASLTAEDRSKRLVDAVRRALPCDAVVLLRLEGDALVPLAAHGLSPDVLGRRFLRAEHPRLDAICRGTEPTSFAAESPLPDPYDGLVEGHPHLDVHACLGCPLRVEGALVGVLTMDALAPGRFDGVDRRFLVHLAALAAAALRTSDLIEALERHARHQGLVAEDLVRDALDRRGGYLIGKSACIAELRREVELVAASEFPVLVTGETGVGKELVVRTLHQASRRAKAPLVYVNCAALPESIAESELFGHAKGAFTGADAARPGKFRVADGATLFLDEVGELPLGVQPKLLRALQEGEVQPVGADRTARVDVRVLAATNRDLEAEVRAGRFRADLFHRLDVVRIRVPPLREHLEDVPLLVGHVSDRVRRRLGSGPIHGEAAALEALSRSDWPGNVRELENVVSRAVLRASARVERGERVLVRVEDLGLALGEPAPGAARPSSSAHSTASAPSLSSARAAPDEPDATELRGRALRDAVDDFQRAVIQKELLRAGGNWAATARALGMDRSNLHHVAKRLGLGTTKE